MAEADVLIQGARVIDGTGNPWRYGDVALQGDRIAAIAPPGSIAAENCGEVVDATGMVVCPGFIDIQSHSILPLMADGRCLSKITQGITTEIMGEVWTPAPFGGRIEDPFAERLAVERLPEWEEAARGWTRFGQWLEAMVTRGVTPNVGSFLPGGTLRRYAMGTSMEAPNADELATMRRVVAESMADGAFGVSYALIYPPESYADTDEIVAICAEVARNHGLYITHLRSEGARLLEALDEAFDIGRRAGLPVEIYHLKAAGRPNWETMPLAIERINAARAAGIDVTADMYPYAASGTGLTVLLPGWVAAGGNLYDRLRDPAIRARIRAELEPSSDPAGAPAVRRDPGEVMPVGFTLPEHRGYSGRRLDDIAAERGQDWIETVLDLLATERQRIATIYFSMSEENLRLQLRQPWIKVSTDAGGVDPELVADRGPIHPRAYGTNPRVLGQYARDEGVLPLEDAVRKMSGAVAARLNLTGRGLLEPGYAADVVIFDPERVADRATFTDSHRLSTGIEQVWVNGTRVVAAGRHTGALPGRVVRAG